MITGGNGVAMGADGEEEIRRRLEEGGFMDLKQERVVVERPMELEREAYATMFGPTTGDRVRLGETELWVKVEKDMTVYGDECKFGGGKTLREGMGQASGRSDEEVLDLVVTNALIVDWTGIYKADIGIKKGMIVGIGKAGNPDMMDGVTEGMIVGSNTDVVAAEGKIVTAGGLDTHVYPPPPTPAYENTHRKLGALHLSSTNRRIPLLRHHHSPRRRHRPLHRHQRL